MEQPRIVSRDEWLVARKALLAREKAHTREGDALSVDRRRLPMVKVETPYMFDTPDGRRSLADLFEDRSQLIVYHFMMGPGWVEGCPSCSFLMDHLDGALPHLANRDVTLVAVSRAPLAEIDAFKRRMGWQFPWVSSYGTAFNRDFHVSFTKDEVASGKMHYNYAEQLFPSEEGPGFSVFVKNAQGDIFHTYSTYGRGGESVLGTYHLLDLVPKGRQEDGLPFPMAWVRHHDRYTANAGAGESTCSSHS
jgi:predicted dithiol-disulfide oxidoreductase (DUF899 family)